jgi:hypothetical protein
MMAFLVSNGIAKETRFSHRCRTSQLTPAQALAAETQHSEARRLRKRSGFECFRYVCPEPVLIK